MIQLPPGKYQDTVRLHNAAAESVTWHAGGNSSALIVAPTQGTLAPGQTTGVLVAVKESELPPGPFSLSFSIVSLNTRKGVLISGTKP